MTFWKSNRSNELQEFIAKLLIALYLSPKFSKQNKNVRKKKKKKENWEWKQVLDLDFLTDEEARSAKCVGDG